MTESAAISSLIHFTGRSFTTAPRTPDAAEASGRPDTPKVRESKGSAATPVELRRTPLLNAENQIAAQEPRAATDEQPGPGGTGDPSNPENLSEEEKKQVQELQRTDREVRAHEQAHKSAGGSLTGSASFKTIRGPDGKSYAVSGEVKIDTSPVPNNPEATIRKLEQVKRAALAPSNPSGQDRRVAAEAEAKIQAARQEKHEKDAEALKKTNGRDDSPHSGPATPGSGRNGATSATPISAAPASGSGTISALAPGSLFNLVA